MRIVWGGGDFFRVRYKFCGWFFIFVIYILYKVCKVNCMGRYGWDIDECLFVWVILNECDDFNGMKMREEFWN